MNEKIEREEGGEIWWCKIRHRISSEGMKMPDRKIDKKGLKQRMV